MKIILTYYYITLAVDVRKQITNSNNHKICLTCIIDDDHEEEDDNGEGEKEEEVVNDDTASQLRDSFAVVIEDLDEGEDIVQPSDVVTATVPVQPSPTARSHVKKKPVM